jgi:hypothetical protein
MVDATAATTATATATNNVPALPAATMKLLVDTKAKRVLYAEGGKEVVDFFFGILALPIGTVAKLLREGGAQAAGAANIYDSAEKMDPAYMKSAAVRDALLNSHRYTLLTHPTIVPQSPVATVAGPSTVVQSTNTAYAPLMSVSSAPAAYTTKYAVPTTTTSITPASGIVASTITARGSNMGGFVQGLVTYTIMDDLTIAPMSNISATVLLSKLNGEDKGLVLEEKSVHIGYQEVPLGCVLGAKSFSDLY